jgi:toxin secretion/phage lysis holin
MFGSWSELLSLLFFVIILDYLTGIGGAIITKKGLNSSIGFIGLIKKFAIVLIVALSYQIDKSLGINGIMQGTIYFFMANELISIVENYGKMNLPLPPQIKKIIETLKEKK